MNRFNLQLIEKFKMHTIIFLFMTILFVTGIIFGAIIVNSMGFIQKQDLFFYLERFFKHMVDEQGIDRFTIWKESFFFHVKYLFLFFLLGLSVVGLPLIWILLFIKGLVIGFSVGFIVNQLGSQGLLFASLSILPHNLLVIPIYIFAASVAMIFALRLFQKIFSKQSAYSLKHPFINYMLLFSILIFISTGVAALEAYVSSYGLETVIKSFYMK